MFNCRFLTMLLCVLFATVFLAQADEESKDSSRNRRDIPIAGQALQATSQVLNHPIVAAALQKISMDALATVASALNQVNQEERAKKSNIEMARTLDKIASLKKRTESHMPMLEDKTTASSGDDDDLSGSGSGDEGNIMMNQSNLTDKSVTGNSLTKDNVAETSKEIKKHHHHHHHHRHHHHRHKRHHHHRHHHKKHHKDKKTDAVKTEKDATNHASGISISEFDWSSIKDNRSVVDTIALHANIPARKLLDIIESGASRSDISKQTEVLLNRTISNQADLAALYRGEEMTPEDDEQSHGKRKASIEEKKSGHVVVKAVKNDDKVEVTNTTVGTKIRSLRNKTKDYVIPKEIPSSCGKLVKAYTNGEMTLRDYLKELSKCKKEEAIAKRLANTTPEQREAVATEDLIQQEAYKYALKTMKQNRTSKEAANDVMDKWRTNSFGSKKSGKPDSIPDTVKSFMNGQSVGIGVPSVEKPKQIEDSNKIKTPETPRPDSFESAKSMILSHVTGKSDGPIIDYNPKFETGFQDALYKRTNVPANPMTSAALSNLAVLNKLKTLSQASAQPHLDNANFFPNLPATNSHLNIAMARNAAALGNFAKLQNMKKQVIDPVTENLITKQTLIARSEIPVPRQVSILPQKKMEIPDTVGGALLQKHLLAQEQPLTKPLMQVKSQIKGPQTLQQMLNARSQIATKLKNANLVSNLQTKSAVPSPVNLPPTVNTVALPNNRFANLNPKLPENPALDLSQSLLHSITASSLLGDENLQNENKNLLNGQELAAERIIASLANPILRDMPVDNSLVAALNEMAGTNKDSLESDPKQSIAMATLMKRQINDSRKHKKRQLSEPAETRHPRKRDINDVTAKLHKKHKGKSHGKRDTTDKIKSAKAIERSSMGLPLTSVQQGPKLMDKIRDMSRVIATP